MIKVRVENTDTGEILEFEGDKVRVVWHNDTYEGKTEDDPEWHYKEIPEVS